VAIGIAGVRDTRESCSTMPATDTNVFPADWLSTSRAGSGADVVTARFEDVFDAWVFAAHDAELALEAWAASPRKRWADAHAVYRAALDREERAAAVLAVAASP
jgi:hypothetical protein